MMPLTFTIANTSGINVQKIDAGGSLKPLADGSYITTSSGTTDTESAKRPHVRLVD